MFFLLKKEFVVILGILFLTVTLTAGMVPSNQVLGAQTSQSIFINHNYTKLANIPESFVLAAKQQLHIAYGHTSHGSQLVDGMNGLVGFKGQTYSVNSGGTNGALDLRDTPFSGASDLGNPNWTAWADATKIYLNANGGINVVMWSWCGQVSGATEANINTYLTRMNTLESEFPNVKFVYFTGHLDGTGLTQNLNLRNNQIRQYCINNNKILYDFADIESYNPDGEYFGDKTPNDACEYDSNGDNVNDKNWAIDWQNSHTVGVDWYNCSSAHSQPLNANQKAYAAWALFARLSGWSGNASETSSPSPVVTNSPVGTSTPTPTQTPVFSPTPMPTPTLAPTPTTTATVSPKPTPKPVIHVKSVKLNKISLSLTKGKTFKLIPTINPINASNKKVTWKSSNVKITTVSSSGTMKGIKKGIAYITVVTVDGKKSARCKVVVK